ncbi:hypothetical protein [Heliorestis convoluta]|uniref:Uncharacterized protein n=1 Tax=Heliorestis convoluta TaxID=356322 RepID=A0A5Q2N5X3_9FIRM|nr:hypothetical protein [Heliorestis convoluta]QGG47650.1 hypothetical protein FTV88_1550 [Heliorestis convoluta]
MIPLKQTVKVRQAGRLDSWGIAELDQITSYFCRIDEAFKVVKDSNGKEVISQATVLIKGLASISMDDQIEWRDELHRKHSKRPISISVIRDFSGKPLFTKVSL